VSKKKKEKHSTKKVWELLGKYTWFLVAAVVFSLLDTFFHTLLPQVFRFAIDVVIGGEGDAVPSWLSWLPVSSIDTNTLLIGSAVAVLVLAVLAGVSGYVSGMSMVRASEKFIKDLRDRLFSHVQRIEFPWLARHKTGDIIQRCTTDVDIIRGFVAGQLREVFRILVLVAISLGMMFSMDVQLTLVVLIFIPIIVTYSTLFRAKIGRDFLKADEAEGELSSGVQENLTGVRVVRAFGREQYEVEQFDKKNNYFSGLWLRLGRVMGYFWSLGDMLTGIQILVVISVGAAAAVDGRITLGEFLAFVSYNASLVWPIRALGRILSEMSKAGVSLQRVAYILEAKEEDNTKGTTEAAIDKDIVFSNVSYRYEGEDEKEVLKDVSFSLKAGKTYAILGGTGSGKSTLIHLLVRLYDLPKENGSITIGGVDISEIKREHLRKNIGIVLQEPFLFSRTVGENIRAVCPEAELSEMKSAARIACVDDALSSFTNGYETMVGERGVTLSGGQKQRVAIARMLMQKTPVMVFDDSLSAVDSETDSKIRASLKEQLGETTVILISHRITTLMHADEILVLENGEMVETGSHRELLNKDGIYKSIYDIQMRSEDRDALKKESTDE